MAEPNDTSAPAALEGSSYEVIRARLLEKAAELSKRAESLNLRRKQEFGGQELTVIGNERVRTEHNCVPRDIVAIGKHLLLGFNVFIGLKKETHVSDVFSMHKFEKTAEGFDLSPVGMDACGGFLVDRRFEKDFVELYQYYKDTRLAQLLRTDSRLLAIFRIGATSRDYKVFRFGLDETGRATYIDNRGEGDWKKPPSHDFEWKAATREQFVMGKHPHVNVLDEVFVETVGGDLTIKVENNTEDGLGIYSEPVEDKDQSLDDAEIHYAKVGPLVLLKVLPFREEKHRYLVFNSRTRHVVRIDAIGQACAQLPEDQGIVFPGGYYLQTGEHKVFDGSTAGLELERAVRSPNGEDVLYVFHEMDEGRYVLLPYNLVRKEVSNPIVCHGWSLFSDGKMVVFRSSSDEPTRVHPMQIWQTPFVSPEHALASPRSNTFLGKIGNAELVRGISDALTLERMAKADKPTRRTYEDLISACTRAIDAYHWLGHGEIGLQKPIEELRKTAELIVDEFEKVQQLKKRAADAVAQAQAEQDRLVVALAPHELTSVESFMSALTALKKQRGHLITLKDLRYVDVARLEQLEKDVAAHFDRVSESCVELLLRDEALRPLKSKLEEILQRAQAVTRTAEIAPLFGDVEQIGAGLELVGEIVGGLQVGDPANRAKILEAISEVFARLNRVRATVAARRKELLGHERRSEFAAQFKLLSQSIESALAQCDTPERCDEQLSRLSVQLEEIEGRFSEFDELVAELAKKREEMLEALESRKQTLLDERQRRAHHLFSAAERIFAGIARRAKAFKSDDELNGYFASDPMVQKLKQIAHQLLELKDSVRADEIESRLKTARQEALRSLRDRRDLFEDGANVIRLGPYRFNVNTQPLELTVVPRDGRLNLHITGSDFLQPLEDPELEKAKELWEQTLVSESPDVYRGEFLAASVLFSAERHEKGLSLDRLLQATRAPEGLLGVVRQYAADRYDEGYDRGIHDADAAAILERLLLLREGAGLLRFSPAARAWACLFWAELPAGADRAFWQRRAQSLGRLRQTFSQESEMAALGEQLGARIGEFLSASKIDHLPGDAVLSGRYLAEELAAFQPRFATAAAAVKLRDALLSHLELNGTRSSFEDDLRALAGAPLGDRFRLCLAWIRALASTQRERTDGRGFADDVQLEAAALLLADERRLDREVSTALVTAEVSGLLGQHPRIADGKLALRLDEFVSRLSEHMRVRVPAYQAYRARIRAVLERERARLRLDELQPKVLSTFVRNRLIDEVYLPLIGANLAKQLGAAGETKRTDRMGMLLVISPPGYGKTTLMEYVASRLGLAFVKVNGPALGHEVKSIDPNDAPNATARQEVERINLAFEMGNNVMLYLDDIQHTNPELLQKFISLCDAQRRIEGVWNGRSRTYDLRGKKFCVVMAGNPYTESGERFQIPDMLANRADTYNLGDILAGKDELFALSYVENALTSNPVTAPLLTRPPGDVHKLIRMAQGEAVPTTDLEHGYSAVELQEIVAVLKRLLYVQRTLLLVNQQYIASASQDERFRTEPPFKLQGSYRNMNKLAEKIVAAMTDEELERLIDDHYQGESQTLTTAAEHNLLKLAELRHRMTDEQRRRWEEIKKGFKRVQTMGGKDDDPVVRVTAQLASLGEELSNIREAVAQAAQRASNGSSPAAQLAPKLDALGTSLLELARAQAQKEPGPPPAELLARVDAIREGLQAIARAVAESARAVPPPPPAPDLGPYFERLGEVLKAVAERAPAAPPGLKPRAEPIGRQLQLLHEALSPLATEARRTIQSGGAEGRLDPMDVWKRVNEALELVKAMGGRPPRPPPRGGR